MITSSLDHLIHSLGGIVALTKEMANEGVTVTHTSVAWWYTSKNLHPSRKIYRDAIHRIAARKKIPVNMDAE